MNIKSLDKEIMNEIYNALCKLEKILQKEVNDEKFKKHLSFNKYTCSLSFAKNKLFVELYKDNFDLETLNTLMKNDFKVFNKDNEVKYHYSEEGFYNLTTYDIVKFYNICVNNYDEIIKNKVNKLNDLKNIEFNKEMI